MTALPEIETMIAQLIEKPSISSANPELDQSNRPVLEQLANWAEDLGFSVELMETNTNPAKGNLIARLGSGPGGLVLAGHTDTVPCNPERWRSDPWTLEERDGRLYGLGTADMKSFLALALQASQAFSADKLREPVILVATADEESSMDGARALAEQGALQARRAIIGEPTSLAPIRMHKGILLEVLKIMGRSGHSSNPALGNSALDGMTDVLQELIAVRQELQEAWQRTEFPVPGPTLNLGRIEGGDNPNRICAFCELQFDVRLLPGMEMEATRNLVRQRVANVLRETGLEWTLQPLFGGVPPLETPADAVLVQTAEKLTGKSSQAVAFATEAPFLQQLGIETIIMGPGSIDQAHQPDEYIPRADIAPTIHLLESMIHRFCVEPPTP